MKKTVALLFYSLISISFAFSQSSNLDFIQFYNNLGSNIYTSGHYSVSQYDVESIADVFILNYKGQIVSTIIISNHDYSKLALNQLIQPFVGIKNSFYNATVGSGVFIAQKGLLISSMEWGAIIISNSVLNSDKEIRSTIYDQIFNELLNMINKKSTFSNICYSILYLFEQYENTANSDLLLVNKCKSTFELK